MVYRCLLFIPVSLGSTTCRPFWILVWNLHWLQPASGEKTCSCCGGYIRLAVSSAERSYMKTKKVSLDDSFRVRNGKWGFIQSILPFWMSKGFKGFTNTEKRAISRPCLTRDRKGIGFGRIDLVQRKLTWWCVCTCVDAVQCISWRRKNHQKKHVLSLSHGYYWYPLVN